MTKALIRRTLRQLCVVIGAALALPASAIIWHESTRSMTASITEGLPLGDTTDEFFERVVYEDSELHFPQYTNYLGDNRSFLSNYLWLNPEYAGYPDIRHIAVAFSWIYRTDINGNLQPPYDETTHRFRADWRTETIFTWNGGRLLSLYGTDPWQITNLVRIEKGVYVAGVFVPTSIIADFAPGYQFEVLEPGTYRYTVDQAYEYMDAATFYRSHGANITLYENPNSPPVAVDDFYGVNQLSTLSQASPGIIVNDSDPDEDALTAELISGPAHATYFNLNSDGSFVYTPVLNYFGEDTFTYRVFDGTVYSEPATVHITVRQPNSQGFITGGGKYFASGRKCTFGFVAKVLGSGVQGNLEFQDHDAGIDVNSSGLNWVYAPNATDGYFSGTCRYGGQTGFTFFVTVHDRGEPGRNDDFQIWVFDDFGSLVYDSAGQLAAGGNIQIHQQ